MQSSWRTQGDAPATPTRSPAALRPPGSKSPLPPISSSGQARASPAVSPSLRRVSHAGLGSTGSPLGSPHSAAAPPAHSSAASGYDAAAAGANRRGSLLPLSPGPAQADSDGDRDRRRRNRDSFVNWLTVRPRRRQAGQPAGRRGDAPPAWRRAHRPLFALPRFQTKESRVKEEARVKAEKEAAEAAEAAAAKAASFEEWAAEKEAERALLQASSRENVAKVRAGRQWPGTVALAGSPAADGRP
jgi:hypothetical protein